MINKEMAAHNLTLLRLQAEHAEALSDEDLYAKYAELYNKFLEAGKKYEHEHSHGTRIGEF
jgi:hypothetical protein